MTIGPERREALQELAAIIAEPGKEVATIRPLLNTFAKEFGGLSKEEQEILLMECCDVAERGFSGPHRERIAKFRDTMRRLLASEPEPEPTPEPSPEAHNFSRLLTDILADPEQKDRLIKKLMLPNGRMWIDRRVRGADGTEKTIRIWLSLGLTAEDMTQGDAALKSAIETKLQSLPLRYRVDDLSAGHSWKDQWTEMKRREGIPEAVANLKSACIASARRDDDISISNVVDTIATRIGFIEGGEMRNSFTKLLKHYTTLSGAEMDLWTHVRNAYWHASSGWNNEADASSELRSHGTTTPLPRPTVGDARIHLWQKITEEPRSAEMEGKVARLSYNGVKFPPQSIVKTVVADGPQKGTWYQIGPHHVREEHLRISLRQDPPLAAGDPLTEEGTFELLAWDALLQPPDTSPPPEREPGSRPPPGPHPERKTPAVEKPSAEIPSNNNGNDVISVQHLYDTRKGKVSLIHQKKIGDCVLIAFLNTYVLEHGYFPKTRDGKPMGVNDARALAVHWARERGEPTDDIKTPANTSNMSALNNKDAARLFSWIHGKSLQQADIETIESNGGNIGHILDKLNTYHPKLCLLGMGLHARALKKIGDNAYVIVDPFYASGGETLNRIEVQEFIRHKLDPHRDKNVVIFVRGRDDAGDVWENPTMRNIG